jgi:hypothetical protein
MVRRLNFAVNLGNGSLKFVEQPKPIVATTLDDTIGIQLKPNTIKQIQAQPAKLRAGLMLGSPEFMYY